MPRCNDGLYPSPSFLDEEMAEFGLASNSPLSPGALRAFGMLSSRAGLESSFMAIGFVFLRHLSNMGQKMC